ncbi:TOMM system kinase/cyclase fusion protein [Endozoicomonas sp. SM1973]|uniref:TOMM system kinase/cyclase fusion protein n=1 Tax=Spartinivicinus marinus TaxID=2994442 RepID=A0A853IA60_9GAMM|nr:TOMM system kinase/cyclase fusion protein [Spartinivicinus marinus]MCX4029675.1 TOMM system kinase/cyclase fusion protein [Spartinivicinus marinus]NYZ66944.1 TOMM system kinase/cyclase fusion protein [Spartinivicinus marinus]
MESPELLLLNKNIHLPSDKYSLIEKIGEGGFGQVYKAKQTNTGQLVAIKFLTLNPAFNADKKRRYIERFARETLLCSRLHHPHIVRLLDKGQEESDLLYAVFEYVEGLSLKERLARSGPLLPAEAAQTMAQVLDALAHAHKQGVVHRDIKPANIMLSQVGATTHVKILDFGIGSLVNEARQLDYKTITLTQETLGTPSYSAPEQLRGEPPTPQTDIYVWGLVFLECLTGKPAVSGSNLASIFHKQLSHSNIPIPPAIAGHPVTVLLRRVLNKKANERAANAAELYHEFTQINLATIVGDLSEENASMIPPTTTQAVTAQYNKTIVNDTQFYHTSLTEVKQLTVLCLTLQIKSVVDVTANTEILDTLHRDQKAQCIDTAIRFGAYHVGTLGDTLLFYFGYPKVSENDCRLSARTALEIFSNLTKTNALLKKTQGVEIHPKIGIHTGAVTIYSDATPEGETPNLAMELARLAMPMQVLCSEFTKNQLERYIEFEPTSAKVTSYQQRELLLYSLKAERAVEAFGFLRANHSNQNFIARQHELNQLIKLLNNNQIKNSTDQNHTQFAHVWGEAGIGKSRLIFEFRRKATSFNHYIAQCLPEHKNNALYPVLNLLKYQYALDSISPEKAIQVLKSQVNNSGQLDEKQSIPILYSWLGLPLPDYLSDVAFSPDSQKQILFITLSCLLNQQSNLTSNQHNLYIFEDIHWADPTTLEFIAYWLASEAFAKNQAIFVSTSREVIPQHLSAHPFTIVELSKLDYNNTAEFIISRFEHQNVSDQVLDIVATRTDGIPLFIEEMVNMLKQKQLVQYLNGIIDFSSPDKINEVPSSLRESLQQKLDSLVYGKETAQLAATIGREFNYKLLVSASSRSEEQVQIDLNELIEADLVYLQRKIGDDTYIFKHALVRDAAYESIPSDKLEGFHKYVADTLVSHFESFIKNNPGVVADHYHKANDFILASQYGIKDVSNLSQRSLDQEAEQRSKQVNQWIALINSNQSVEKRITNELQLQLNSALLPVRTKIQGWGAKGIKQLAEENIQLINHIKDSNESNLSNKELSQLEYKAEWVLLIYHHYQGNRKIARKLGEELLKKARQKKDRIQELIVRTTLGQAYFFDCDFSLAKETLAWVIENYDHEKDINLNIEYGFDPYHFSSGNIMAIEALTGNITKALQYRDNCLAQAIKTNNISTIATGYTWGTIYYFIMYDREGMRQWCEEGIKSYGKKFQDNWILDHFYMNYDWTQNQYERAAKTVKDCIESGQVGFLHWYDPLLARTYIEHRMFNEAVNILESSLKRSQGFGDICILSILYRHLAIAYYCQAGYLNKKSEDCFQKAISEAQQRHSIWQEFMAIYEYLKYSEITSDRRGLYLRLKEIILLLKGTNDEKHLNNNAHFIQANSLVLRRFKDERDAI